MLACVSHATVESDIQRTRPLLSNLLQKYGNYYQQLTKYASQQGFRRPVENMAVVIHEMIHIDSAIHQGFLVDGVYYEPYLNKAAWPDLTNAQIEPLLTTQERSSVVFSLYFRKTPNNNLGNIVDEINAYGQTIGIVCENEPESKLKQVTNLISFLHLSEGYLRAMRTGWPAEYVKFVGQREANGAFTLVVRNAWTALTACGVHPSYLPAQEASYLFARTASPKAQ